MAVSLQRLVRSLWCHPRSEKILAMQKVNASAAIPMQQSATIIEIRPYRGGWQCFEGLGVQPYWTGKKAKEDAIGYATARAKFSRGEIRVLQLDGSIKTVIPFGEWKKV